ncbi:alpha-galactosidase [Paenibacillus cremeus]|uniref:Alpha-galactosidase n=1 Tax=Paenibacillus cremeus TaxID=2163881 RepID=A0A559K787_9BACL|nr:alpha-galactosidase [Paenibacillus cremeus]TVY07989.1 alpha-galactosidase [Paenibacillus cremeus]
MSIRYFEKQKMWILKTKQSEYGIGIDGKGNIVNLYWGGLQTSDIDYFDIDRDYEHPGAGAMSPYKDEIMPWGGYRFAEPGIKVTFSDQIRDLKLVYSHFEIKSDNVLIIYLKDDLKPLLVKLHYKLIPEFDLIERHVELVNEGSEPISVEQLMGAIWHFPIQPDYHLTYLTGLSRGENKIRHELINEGKKVLESRQGRTSHHANPWYAIDFGDAQEEQGDVYFGAIAFSGNWKIVVERTNYQTLQVAAGFNDFDFTWHLKPSETFSSPTCIGGFTKQGFGEASRNLHSYQLKYILRNANELRPVVYNSWYPTEFAINEENQKALANQAAALGAEYFVVDDGWFGDRFDDHSGLGDWYPSEKKFPNGLNPLIDHVKSLGMKFGIWIEPEMVNPDSHLYRKHPEWVYHFPGRKGTELRNQLVLNFCREDVREYIYNCLDELLSKHDIAYVKWDMNRSFSEPGWPEAPSEHHKEIWVRHTYGVYGMLEKLQKKHPRVMIESCSAGGARMDMGIMKYAYQLWPSDNTDPFDRLFIQEGNSLAYTPKAMMAWVTASPDDNNLRKTSLKYRFHSAMMCPLGFSLIFDDFSPEELEEIKSYISQYKEIRETTQNGKLYRLVSPRSQYGAAFQFVNDECSQTVLFAFRHAPQFRHPSFSIRLRGLDPQGIYACKQFNLERSGASLMNRGVNIPLWGDYSSELLVFDKIN